MLRHHVLKTSLSSLVFKSLFDLYFKSEFRRECCSISDLGFAQFGVLRCLSSEKTGQGFLQLHADEGVADIDPGHFFKALKSEMEERKSWGSPIETKKAHAMFECISHNLALLLENDIKKTEGMYDELEEAKSKGRLKSKESGKKKKQQSYINTIVMRCSHRTMRFIRWIRNRIYSEAPLSQSLARLSKLWRSNNQ